MTKLTNSNTRMDEQDIANSYEDLAQEKLLQELEAKRVNVESQTSPYSNNDRFEDESTNKPESYILSYVALQTRLFDGLKLRFQEGGNFFNILKNNTRYINFWSKTGIEIEWMNGITWLNYQDYTFSNCKIEFHSYNGWATITSKGKAICMVSAIGTDEEVRLAGFTTDLDLAYIREEDRITTEWNG